MRGQGLFGVKLLTWAALDENHSGIYVMQKRKAK